MSKRSHEQLNLHELLPRRKTYGSDIVLKTGHRRLMIRWTTSILIQRNEMVWLWAMTRTLYCTTFPEVKKGKIYTIAKSTAQQALSEGLSVLLGTVRKAGGTVVSCRLIVLSGVILSTTIFTSEGTQSSPAVIVKEDTCWCSGAEKSTKLARGAWLRRDLDPRVEVHLNQPISVISRSFGTATRSQYGYGYVYKSSYCTASHTM